MSLGGEERHRRCDHDVRDRGKLLGSRLRLGDEGGDHGGRGRQDQHAADDRVDLAEAVLEPGRDPEVAAAAADRPEQVRMRLRVHVQQLPVGGHQLGCEEVVDGEPVLADEEADAASERETADPDRARIAEPGREPVRPGGSGVLDRSQTRLRPGRPAGDVDLDRLQLREIEDDPALGDAVAGEAVATAADGELEPLFTRERDGGRDLGRVRRSEDRCRPPVDAAVEDTAGGVVPVVVRGDDPAVQVGTELLDHLTRHG